jgi:iron complex transport system ATP-binding protein
MIECQDISIGYGQKTLVESLNLSLPAGTVSALIGSNGAGKSSLLRVLNGLQEASRGSVKWKGRALQGISRAERARMASSVYSSFSRVEGFSVRDLVALGRSNYTGFFGRLSQSDYEAVDRSIGIVGLSKIAGKEITTLSDGEFRKALLAKLLAQDTDILFLDEPTSHLDLPAALEFVQVLRQLASRGKTILFSTHHLALAFKMADQIILLDGMGNSAVGTPSQMTNHAMICDFLRTDKIKISEGNLIIDL